MTGFARSASAGEAGFTLLEALVALAVTAVCLAAIGALMATNERSARQIDQRLTLISTLRKVETALPDRAHMVGTDLSGEMAGNTWAVSATPYPDPSPPPPQGKDPPAWLPQRIVVKVQSPSGSRVELETLRLVPKVAP